MNQVRNLIFIVAYNHEEKIEKVISRIPRQILESSLNEVLIIDDGSKDQTFYKSDAITFPPEYQAKITVLKNPANQGYGGNQKLGYRYAIDQGFDRVYLIHGDGQYAPELLTEFFKIYESNVAPDAVFGTRMHNWSSPLKGGMPAYKFVGNKILTFFQNLILKSTLSEFHSGYRSYSVNLLKKIPFEANSNDFHFDTEIIIQCLAKKAKIVEIPIPTSYGDEVCHVNGMSYAKNVLISSLRYQIQKMGFLYDRKFDLTNDVYSTKQSKYSSHLQIVSRVAKDSRVLDIGCGHGNIAKYLIQKGCVVDGVDLLEASEIKVPLRHYRKIDLNKNREQLANLLKENAYDYILLADVLEHMVDPELFLDLIRNSVRSGSSPTFIVCTGNVAFLIVRLMLFFGQFNYGVKGILDRTHTRLFTKKSFHHIFKQCGFEIQSGTGVGLPLSVIFGENTVLSNILEPISAWLARFWPSLAAYQLILEAKALPTTNQLLELSKQHSNDLRSKKSEQSPTVFFPKI